MIQQAIEKSMLAGLQVLQFRRHSALPQKALLVMQAALSVVLVTGSMLLSRSLGNLERQDFGFRSDGLINVAVNPLPSSYSQERLDALYRSLQDRLRRLMSSPTSRSRAAPCCRG